MRRTRRGGTEEKPGSSAMSLGNVTPAAVAPEGLAAEVGGIGGVPHPCARAAEGHVPASPARASTKTGSVGRRGLAGPAREETEMTHLPTTCHLRRGGRPAEGPSANVRVTARQHARHMTPAPSERPHGALRRPPSGDRYHLQGYPELQVSKLAARKLTGARGWGVRRLRDAVTCRSAWSLLHGRAGEGRRAGLYEAVNP